jgi:N-acetylmuramoyl-L-alanine amidase
MTTRFAPLVGVCVIVAIAVAPCELRAQGAARPVEALFADVIAGELAVQKALADADATPAALKAVRTVVSGFEDVVRHYPASGYSDDALWRAARLSIDAFERFGEPRDRNAAVRLLQALSSQYPASKFVRQVPGQIALINAAARVRPDTPTTETSAAPISPVPAAQSAPTRRLATIKGIRRAVLPDSVRVIIELDAEVPFHDERLSNPSRVFVDLPSTRATAALVDRTIRFESDADVVRQVRIGRHPNHTTRIVLDTDGVSSYSVYPLYSPYRLVIDCLRRVPLRPSGAAPPTSPKVPEPLRVLEARRMAEWSRALPAGSPGVRPLGEATAVMAKPNLPSTPVAPQAAAPPTPAPITPSRNLAGGLSIARQLGLGVSRIVIDPGHGGYDPGAQVRGLSEAELVLDIALRLEKLLTNVPGIDVVLTRRGDDHVPLQERTAMANRESADLFLSIHANASANGQARGVETYFLNFATNLGAASVAARENAGSAQSMAALPDVVKTIALNNKLDESRDFATFVQRAMIRKLRSTNKAVKDLGVKQAPFVVLIGAAMPSVLAEVSFLTNAQEAKLLKSPAYRQRIADALFDAIRKYQASLKSDPASAQEQ